MNIGERYGDFIITGEVLKKLFTHKSGNKSSVYYVPLKCSNAECGHQKDLPIAVYRSNRAKLCNCNPLMLEQKRAAIIKARDKNRNTSDDHVLPGFFEQLQKQVLMLQQIKGMRRT